MLTPALYDSAGQCPWCGELVELTIDCSAGDQWYVEDCQVCCAPIVVVVSFKSDASPVPIVSLGRENE
ncbi:MAG: CPXCG motif-containing cysteine-rich protein [Thiohalocapsa sp.]